MGEGLGVANIALSSVPVAHFNQPLRMQHALSRALSRLRLDPKGRDRRLWYLYYKKDLHISQNKLEIFSGLQKYEIKGGTVPPSIAMIKLEVGSKLCKKLEVKSQFYKKLEVGSQIVKKLEVASQFLNKLEVRGSLRFVHYNILSMRCENKDIKGHLLILITNHI